MGELYDKTMRRIEILKDLGFVVIYIWESDYMKMKKDNNLLMEHIASVKNMII